MDYVVCDSENLEELQRRVSNYLRLDYRLAGGIAVVRERVSGPLKYCQAVVKNGSEPATGAWSLSTQSALRKKRGRPPKLGQSAL